MLRTHHSSLIHNRRVFWFATRGTALKLHFLYEHLKDVQNY